MITKNYTWTDTGVSDFFGLSTDTKPTEGIHNTSTFYEMDTKKLFMFDEEHGVWLEQ